MTQPLTREELDRRFAALKLGPVQDTGIVAPGHTPEMIVEPHAWDTIDLREAIGPPPEATILLRTDGAGLFYPGVRNFLYAPFESAKTWMALLACLQIIQRGGSALYIDFESTPRAVANRLRAIGGMDFAEQFGYIRPNLPVDNDRLAAVLDRLQPELVVVDACAEAMVTHELDENNNAEFMKFSRLMLEPIEERGHAVLLLDHIGHQGDKPRGASAKLATIPGSALRIEVETPFRRGHNDGLARVFVAKDREGAVRQHSTAETLVAYLHLTTDRVTGKLLVELDPPAGPTFVPTEPRIPQSMAEMLKQRAVERSAVDGGFRSGAVN